MLEIQKGVEIPKSTRVVAPSRRKYPFETMEVGDMFFVAGKKRNTLSTHASTVGKKLKKKFITRMTTDDDGNEGVGVWRTE